MDEFAERVAEWHNSDDPRPLHEYLGIPWDQYKAWVERRPFMNSELLREVHRASGAV